MTAHSEAHDELVGRARAVLDRNRAGNYTCPSVRLYPHQWLWDSCFTAIGIARFDPPRAADELRALFRGQWANGMLPHMVFADGSRDVGSRRVWRSQTRAGAPRDVATTCITQPPLVAIAVERVAAALPSDERETFVGELAPKVLEYHRWLFRERRLDDSPLITLIHPWECGLDSTPPWMRALEAMRMPWWVRAAERLHLAALLRSLRYDTRQLPASERASDDDGLRMLALAIHLARHDFEPGSRASRAVTTKRRARGRPGVQRVLRRREPVAARADRRRRARSARQRAGRGARAPVRARHPRTSTARAIR